MARKSLKKRKSGVYDYYNAISGSYDELHGKEQIGKLKVIEKVIMPEKNDLLLDVGCGTCLSFDFFKCNVKGVEPSKEMVLKHPKADFLLGKHVFVCGAEDLKKFFGEKSFDFVICVTVAHHFIDAEESFLNMADAGKDDCVFVFSLLKDSGNYGLCVNIINKLFQVFEIREVHRDKLFFCRKKR